MRKRIALSMALTIFFAAIVIVSLKPQTMEAVGTIYITVDGSIDPPTAPIKRVGNTYSFTSDISSQEIIVQRNNIVIDGAGHMLKGAGSGTRNGIYLEDIENVTIKNTIVSAVYAGIYLAGSSHVILYGNNIFDSWSGVLMLYSLKNSAYENVITRSIRGLDLTGSFNNSIYRNDIGSNTSPNSYGIRLTDSSNNSIYHNNFVENSQGQVVSENSVNLWDDGYPSGGNYWSDYNGTDADHDGIGDSSYVIDANNRDLYPLMAQHAIPEFPSFIILQILMIATLPIVIAYRRTPWVTEKRRKTGFSE